MFSLQEAKSAEFNYRFDTSNGIFSQASGVGGVGSSGSSQYYAPDGTPVSFTYTADENGYVAKGSHIPTPHPIPAYILESLEHNRLHPQEDDSQGSNPNQNRVQTHTQQQQTSNAQSYQPPVQVQTFQTPNGAGQVQTAQQFQTAGNAQRKTETKFTETPDGGQHFQYNTQHKYQQQYQQAQQTHYTIQQQF